MKPTEAKKMKLTDNELDFVSGGVGEAKKYYCVEGYSKAYGGNVKLYVSTYNDAAKLCEKLGLGTDCIKEVSRVH